MPMYEALPRNSSSSFAHTRARSFSSSSHDYKPSRSPFRLPSLRSARRHATRLLRRPLPLLTLLTILFLAQITLNASYTPSTAPPFSLAPSAHETVFIAANIVDGTLIRGAWGESLLQLVEMLGPERVFVSVYGGPGEALRELDGRLGGVEGVATGVKGVPRRMVSEEDEPLDFSRIPTTVLPTGEARVKRIAYLAEVRNKVLEPLYTAGGNGNGLENSHNGDGSKRPRTRDHKYDKVLFLNDVHFDPLSALGLLFGTHVDADGVARYRAVCAADFVSAWKFYDTFATRDAEGYSIGFPIFPWFASEGEARSRRDVLEGRDAVRVKSCWGGMVAFDGAFFGEEEGEDGNGREDGREEGVEADGTAKTKVNTANNGLGEPSLPLRFRSEPEPFWDSSECCLIHADIISLPASSKNPKAKAKDQDAEDEADPWDTGIYMNPYVRTSYSARTHSHIWLARRFERLFSPLQRMLNYFAGMPRWNYRREEREGERVRDRLWVSVTSNLTVGEAVGVRGSGKREVLGTVKGKEYWAREGHYVDYERVARRGGYCGVRQLLVMKEGQVEEGEGNWDNLLDRVPPVDI